MRAVIYDTYGDRSVMRLAEVGMPEPGKGQVRVRVQAVSVNPVDGKVRRGELKLIAGGHFPRTPGLDFAGIVDHIGPEVAGLQMGDPVFGGAHSMSSGALAEFAVVNAVAIGPRPPELEPVSAACVPVAGCAALQVLRELVQVQAGDDILINGCTGGVGLFAIQVARRMGARVTGVCGTDGVATARAFGAHEVIDYRTGSVDSLPGPFRAILELSGRLAFERAERLLADRGLYVDFSPSPSSLIGNTIANPFRSHKHVFAMTSVKEEDLRLLARWLAERDMALPPVRQFPLEAFGQAYEAVESGGVIGKVAIVVAD